MKLDDLNLLPEDEQRRLVALGTGAELPFPADATIAEIFRERAASSPNIPAVVLEDSSLTYLELDAWSDQLAGELIAVHGVGPDRLVGLCFGRSIEMIVAIIAVWKAGGAYVPLDPETPDERARYMLSDTAARVILCGEGHQDWLKRISAADVAVLTVDGPLRPVVHEHDVVVPQQISTHAENLAYVVYTSGTTGNPKGVMIENRSVVNYASVISDLYGFAGNPGEEVMVQALNYTFDGGIAPMVLALLTGNTLLLIPGQLWHEGDRFTDYLRDHDVTHMNGTPTFYKHLGLGAVPSLKRMVVGGEMLDAVCVREMTRANQVSVFNEYGPTEATISTTSHAAREYDLAIGRPQSNSYVLVLDESLRPAPIGAVGELFLTGPGLARGYLNLPEATKERFIANPFQTKTEKSDLSYGADGRNARLYQTGDFARRRSDGAIEYVGRNDSQVKVRGFRVELSEIEATLNQYPGVTQSVILPDSSRNRFDANDAVTALVGYYISEAPLNTDEIRRYLEHRLHSYMLPRDLLHMTALPMTVNGKLDTQALRALRAEIDSDHVRPRTELQTNLQRIVAGVIGVDTDRIGMQDDLFRLGLNSILAVKLIAEVSVELQVDVAIPSLFMYPTIEELIEIPEFEGARAATGASLD